RANELGPAPKGGSRTRARREARSAALAVHFARSEDHVVSQNGTGSRRVGAFLVIALLALPAAFQGCSSPTAPVPPPSGGSVPHLSYDLFVQTVEPVIGRLGCDAVGDCHGGGIRGTLALSPPTAKDPQFDFEQVSLEVLPAQPDSSPILTR